MARGLDRTLSAKAIGSGMGQASETEGFLGLKKREQGALALLSQEGTGSPSIKLIAGETELIHEGNGVLDNIIKQA